jgi:hypothetical protein
MSDRDTAKLDGIETAATADQTGAEIVAAINTQLAGVPCDRMAMPKPDTPHRSRSRMPSTPIRIRIRWTTLRPSGADGWSRA